MIDRYSRQVLFREIGKEGQKKLGESSIVIIGCGALGGIIATSLVRAGIGKVKIIDRDFVEYHNLHRQIVFDEEDVKSQTPKAVAAERHLKKVNSAIDIEGVVADVNYSNVEDLVRGADLILDGLDNPETRFTINDAAVKLKIPWIYGAAVAASGMTMNIIPGETPCFRCVFPSPPPAGIIPTCDTAGVVGAAPFIIGSLQSAEAIKILVGARQVSREVVVIDVWEGTFDRFKVESRPDCPACQGNYEFLQVQLGIRTTLLCGQNSVQVIDPKMTGLSLEKMAAQLERRGKVTCIESTLHFNVDANEMVIFPDGRVILKNSLDESLARELYVRYIDNQQ